MSVKIQIMSHSASDNSPEFSAAVELKEMLESQFSAFPDAKGNVYIGYSLTLSGQKVRDIDLLIYGEVENCILKSFYAPSVKEQKKDLSIESFCFVIELKDHPISKVMTSNTHLYVNYKDTWKDVSNQSEAQKYSFMNYFYRAKGYKPFVCNLLWFRQISPESMKRLKVAGNEMNVLPSEFTLQDLATQNIAQLNLEKYRPYGGMYHMNVNGTGSFCDDMNELLKERRIVGGLTRKKLESLTQKNIDSTGPTADKLTIFSGRAGVGKTFYLLQTALRLASSPEGYRCLLLTYNQALVSDIRRLLHYIDIPDKVDSYTVQVQPLHDFFIQLMKMLTGDYPEDFTDYLKKYRHGLEQLDAYVNSSLTAEDVQYLKETEQSLIDWDYILVDEAQDWSDNEKNILLKIYGPDHIIVADGIDQFIRSAQKQHWERNLHVNTINKTIGMRQKSNLTAFVNAFAKEAGVKWEIKANKQLLGGKVRIVSEYTASEHQNLVKNCQQNGCENYDILFLIPPKLVCKEGNGRTRFVQTEAFREKGIEIFDGTNYELRDQYSTRVSECRLYQYDSCRGLEGWCTVCLDFDELITYKENVYIDSPGNSLILESPEDRRHRFVYLWSLMPLTRPMDTLVITLKNPESEVGKMLKKLSELYSDFVEWDIP